MIFNFNFYSSLLLITFSQGLIYSILLLKKGFESENKSNYWLGVFIFICSLYIAPWTLGFAGWYDNQPYRDIMFYIPFQQLYLVGPIIYFYTQTLLNPTFTFRQKNLIHFLPAFVYLIYNLWIFFYDKIILKQYYFYVDGMDKDFDQWYQISGQLSMLFYFILSLKYYLNYKKLVVQITSNADQLLFSWIKNYLVAFSIMLLLPLLFELISTFYPELKSYSGSWWFYLLYSIVLFYIAITGYGNNAITKIGFQMKLQEHNLVYFLTETNLPTVNFETIIDINHEIVDGIENQDLEIWKTSIKEIIVMEKLYQNPELSLLDVAKKLETNVAIISKTINQGFGMNFNDYINKFRIEEVKLN